MKASSPAGSSVKFSFHLLWRHAVVSQVLLVHHSRPADCQRVAAEPATPFRVSEEHCHFPHRCVWHTSLYCHTGWGSHRGYLAGANQKFPKGTDYWGKKALMGEPGVICQNKQLSLVLQRMCLAVFLVCKLLSAWFVRWKPDCCLDAPSSLLWHQPDLEKKSAPVRLHFPSHDFGNGRQVNQDN